MKSYLHLFAALVFALIVISCKEKNHPPVIEDQSFSIEENSPAGTIVGTILAADPDDNQIIRFELVDNNSLPFNVNVETGVITVKDEINYEEQNQYIFIIRVFDNANESLSQIANITIDLIDINEFPTNGLVAYFPLNNSTEDNSSNTNSLVLEGTSYAQDRNGINNNAISFDGTNDYAKIIHSSTVDFDGYSDSYTIALWVKSNDPSNGNTNAGRLFTKWNEYSHYNYPVSIWYFNNSCTGAVYHGDKSNKSTVEYGNIWDGEWHMLTFVVNHANNQVIGYVDGEKTEVSSNKSTQSTSNNHDIIIGYCWPNEVYYKGSIDDIVIYNRALTDTEVNDLYEL